MTKAKWQQNLTGGRSAPSTRLARTAASIASFVLALTLGTSSVTVAKPHGTPDEHANPRAKYLHAEAGDLIDVVIGDLHPTQAVLGYYEVFYKLGRYQAGKDAINKRFDDWCEANGQEKAESVDPGARLDDPIPCECTVPIGDETPATIGPMKTVVIGRGGRLYLVDGHHTFTSFLESPDGGPTVHVRVRVLANLSRLGPEEFWQAMQANGWVWLRDANNEPITIDQLPEHLGLDNFQNDDYRGLLYFTRDIAYEQNPDNANFQEFYWGAWLRNNPSFNLENYNLADPASYLDAVHLAALLMSSLKDTDLVDSGLTAGDLGRIDFDNDEFNKLSKNYCNTKPGKVAYALYFYHNILGTPPLILCP